METQASDNLNKMVLFEEIKRKCKSRARNELFTSLCLLLFVIVTFLLLERTHDPHESKNIIFYIFSIVFLCISGWLILFSYRFYKRIDTLGKPEQLLHHFEKKNRNLKIIFLVFWLFMIGEQFAKSATNIRLDYEYVLLGIVVVAAVYLMFVLSRDDKLSRKDLEIVEELRELIGEE